MAKLSSLGALLSTLGGNASICHDENEDQIVNSMTSKVGLEAEPNWIERCSNCYEKVIAPKTERHTDRLKLYNDQVIKDIRISTYALEIIGKLMEH